MSEKILVAFGGRSNENEISVITGTMAVNVLKKAGVEVIPLYITQTNDFYTGEELAEISLFKDDGYLKSNRAIIANGGIYSLSKRGKIKKFTPVDCVLNCCHGGWGEGGGLCGLCAAANLPLAGAGLFESSAFMDKYYTKLVLNALDIKTVEWAYISAEEELNKANLPEYPLIIKPARLGSSIGIARADTPEELQEGIETAFIYDSGVIIEKFIENRREINCAAFYSKGEIITSECEEAIPSGKVLSFEDKYSGGGKSVLPADIPVATADRIKEITREVYSKLNMRGIVRFDYILSDDIYLSEVNTVPGSLSYYLLSKGFSDFYRVLRAVIDQAKEDFRLSHKKVLKTGILQNIPSNACKRGSKQL